MGHYENEDIFWCISPSLYSQEAHCATLIGLLQEAYRGVERGRERKYAAPWYNRSQAGFKAPKGRGAVARGKPKAGDELLTYAADALANGRQEPERDEPTEYDGELSQGSFDWAELLRPDLVARQRSLAGELPKVDQLASQGEFHKANKGRHPKQDPLAQTTGSSASERRVPDGRMR